jgi:hypothetical protein
VNITELEIQRLVDGELGLADHQALLRRLELSPGAWRRVALAFVEDRVWRTACREEDAAGASDTDAPGVRVTPVRTAAAARPRKTPRTTWWPAIVASLLIGVGVGLIADGLRRDPDAVVANNHGQPGSATGEGQAAGDGQANGTRWETARPVLNVELAADAIGQDQSVEVPVYDPAEVRGDLWRSNDMVPERVREFLSRSGYRVEEARRVYTIPLDDGRQIAIPVDSVDVRYVRGL